MENDFFNPTAHENEGLPSGKNLEGQNTLGYPVTNGVTHQMYIMVQPQTTKFIIYLMHLLKVRCNLLQWKQFNFMRKLDFVIRIFIEMQKREGNFK